MDGMSAFGQRLAALRAERGLSLRALAELTNYSRSYLHELERGLKQPAPAVADRLDDALSASGHLAALAERPTATGPDAALLDEPQEIHRRRQRMNTSNVDAAKLQYLEDAVESLINEYERRPPASMAPQARQLRQYVDGMLAGRQHPPQRERLYSVAVHLCGLLGALALDLGRPAAAHAYGLEAFDIADTAAVPDLQAWARATQSLIAYYAGDYHEALAYARDGQRRAPRSPHSVRLAVNGEARALARLGDVYGVDEAVDRAFTALADHPATDGVSASMTLGPYCPARAGANAATAYLALRRPGDVERYAAPALAIFDEAHLRGPQALSRLDLATAALMAPDPDPDRAAQLAAQALAVSEPQRFHSVTKRAREFAAAARPWANQPQVRELVEVVAERSRQPTSAVVDGPTR